MPHPRCHPGFIGIATTAGVLILALASCEPAGPSVDQTGEECDPATGEGCEPPVAAACGPYVVPPGRTCVRWTSPGPYDVTASATFDILVIDAGTEVRAAPGAELVATRFIIEGTAAEPVILGPLVDGEPWGGLVIPGEPWGVSADTSLIRHARIRNAATGIHALGFMQVEDTRVEESAGMGIYLSDGELVRVMVDGADGSGVGIGSNSGPRIEDTVVRNAVTGIELDCLRCGLTISGGAVEDNTGDGIRTSMGSQTGGTVIFESPVRITGNGGYPLVVPLVSMRGVMSDAAARNGLLGNGRDTIIAGGGSSWFASDVPDGEIRIAKTLPFRVRLACPGWLEPLVMEAGASLTVDAGGCPGPAGGPFPTLLGTAVEPVRITGVNATLALLGQDDDTVFVRHARFAGVRLMSGEIPVVMEDVALASSTLVLEAGGSRIARVRSAGGGATGPFEHQQEAAITLGGDVQMEDAVIEDALYHGLRISGGHPIVTGCVIHRSGANGVWVQSGRLRIELCILEHNTSYAIHNSTPDSVQAPNNWWGDPAGPYGPDSDGIDGPVMYQPPLESPVVRARTAEARRSGSPVEGGRRVLARPCAATTGGRSGVPPTANMLRGKTAPVARTLFSPFSCNATNPRAKHPHAPSFVAPQTACRSAATATA